MRDPGAGCGSLLRQPARSTRHTGSGEKKGIGPLSRLPTAVPHWRPVQPTALPWDGSTRAFRGPGSAHGSAVGLNYRRVLPQHALGSSAGSVAWCDPPAKPGAENWELFWSRSLLTALAEKPAIGRGRLRNRPEYSVCGHRADCFVPVLVSVPKGRFLFQSRRDDRKPAQGGAT